MPKGNNIMRSHSMKKLILFFVAICCVCQIEPYRAKASVTPTNGYVICTSSYYKIVSVQAPKDIYFNNGKASSTTYSAIKLPKGTELGEIVLSSVSSRTLLKSRGNTYYGVVNFGQTYMAAVDMVITMKPVDSLTLGVYLADDYLMTKNVRKHPVLSDKTFYVASEDLYNTLSVPKPSLRMGFLTDWNPKKNKEASGWENVSLSIGASLSGFSAGTSITVEDSFVNAYDYSDIETGLYKVRYDYKKYNSIGYCSKKRKEVIFGQTYVKDAVSWTFVPELLGRSYYVHATGSFALCDGKSWPERVVCLSATVTSEPLRIK